MTTIETHHRLNFIICYLDISVFALKIVVVVVELSRITDESTQVMQ